MIRLRVYQKVTDADTPGVWRVGHVGTKASYNIRPGWALLFPDDADAEMYLLLMNTERGMEKIVRPVDCLTVLPPPSPSAAATPSAPHLPNPDPQDPIPGL